MEKAVGYKLYWKESCRDYVSIRKIRLRSKENFQDEERQSITKWSTRQADSLLKCTKLTELQNLKEKQSEDGAPWSAPVEENQQGPGQVSTDGRRPSQTSFQQNTDGLSVIPGKIVNVFGVPGREWKKQAVDYFMKLGCTYESLVLTVSCLY